MSHIVKQLDIYPGADGKLFTAIAGICRADGGDKRRIHVNLTTDKVMSLLAEVDNQIAEIEVPTSEIAADKARIAELEAEVAKVAALEAEIAALKADKEG